MRTADRRGGDKARFVRGVERALLDGEVDLGVHSAKDLPGELPEEPGARRRPGARGSRRRVHRRRGARSPSSRRGPGSGTSSLRRAPSCWRCDRTSRSLELRGNVDTRLAKLAEGELRRHRPRRAGLARLGRDGRDLVSVRPRRDDPGRRAGCLALEARADDEPSRRRGGGDHRPRGPDRADRRAGRRRGRWAPSCDTPVGICAAPRRTSWSCSVTPGCPTAASGFATGSPATPSSPRRSARRWPSGCSRPARASILARGPRGARDERPPGRRLPGRRRPRRPGPDHRAGAGADRERRRDPPRPPDPRWGARRRPRRRRARLRRQAPRRARAWRRRRSRR